MELTNKIEAFKKHFDIESELDDTEFFLEKKNNLIAKFQGSEYVLTNKRNKNKYLSYESMKYAKNYGINFLRAIYLEGPKKIVVKAKEIKKYTDKDMLISNFKYDNKIRKDWDIHSYTYVNEYGELMLNEERCKELKIPKSLRPFS